MADIKDQLIKDSYNYVLQSDLSTGVVYRIGGTIPVNPIFQSGLTINDSFTYSNGTEQNGYTLLTDGTGYAYWGPISGASPSSGDYLPLSGGTVTGNTTFTSGLTINYIDFDTTPNVPNPTGGTLFYDSVSNSLSYKPITNNNDVTVNLGQEGLIKIFNNTGIQINNGQALFISGSTSGVSTVTLSIASGGSNPYYQVDGVATHDIPNGEFGFMTSFGVVNDINLTPFANGEDIYLSQTIAGSYDSFVNLSFTGRTVQIGHVNDNSSLGKLQVNINNESELGLVTAKENNILTADNSSTGLFYFTGLTKVSNTQFSVSPVKGWIIDNTTNQINPSVLYVEYSGGTHTDLYVNTAFETYIYLTSAGTISQQTTLLTGQQRRQNIFLGKVGHPEKTSINLVFSQPDSSLSPVSQLRDMFVPINLINGGVYPSANGANLQFNTSEGYLYGLGINFITNILDPNTLYVSGNTPCTFQYRTSTGGTVTNRTTIDPTTYDLNGVATPVTGTKATNQRIYLLQNGTFRVQYGQKEYNQLSAAVEAISTEQFTVFPNFRNNAVLIGILSVLSTATDLTDTSKALFLFASKFGESVGAAGGISTTTLQQAYNNSSEPEILINSTLDGVSIQNGTGNADNVTSLLQGKNTAGSLTSFVRADGLFSGSSVSTPGFTANTKTTIGSESNISSAILQIASTTQGVLFPRMTNTQRESIVSPVPGLFVYCTDFPEGLFMYKSTGWVQIM